MRHGKKINHLGRTDTHRKAMLANMATSLILHKRITTTLAKAKALRIYVEPLLTKAKNDTTHTRRTIFGYLQSKESVTELFREVAVKIAERPGGYTRIIKTGNRQGDNAEMCFIELVDYNELYSQGKGEEKKEKSTRRGRGRGKKAGAAAEGKAAEATPVAAVESAAEEVKEETVAAEDAPVASAEEETPAEAAEETPAAGTAAAEAETAEVPVSKEAAPEETAPAEPEEVKAEADDLKKIEGIGPKIEEVLLAANINTFALLAGKSEEELKTLLSEAGDQFASHDPATWPKQAELAAAGKWDELKKLQDELQGGREEKKED